MEVPVGADVTAARTTADLVGLFATETSDAGEIMTRYYPPRGGVVRITIELVSRRGIGQYHPASRRVG